MDLPPPQIVSVKIYPTIGIARVGNSKEGWYYGPECPGYFEGPKSGFKDTDHTVKRQAARFRVYGLDKNGDVLSEVTETAGYQLKWSVRVANKKAAWYTFMGRHDEGAFQPGYTTLRNPSVQSDLHPEKRDKLIVDSHEQTIAGSNAGPVTLEGDFYGSKTVPTRIYLGETRTDENGRLVVLPGHGYSRSIAKDGEEYPLITTDFDSADWIDDTCDGWVNVEVTDPTTNKVFTPAHKARVIGTTPKFANGIYAPTTLYDLMEEIYERPKRLKKSYDVGKVEWYRDIWPLLQRPSLLSWVNGQANGGHGPNGPGNFFDKDLNAALSNSDASMQPIRKGVLGRMRLPTDNPKYDSARAGQAYPYFMPWLSGDGGRTTAGDPSTFSSVTELQYDRLTKWSDGAFQVDSTVAKQPTNITQIATKDQPAALTKASLENTIGAPLYPGIEMSWNAELEETYELSEPFTINDNVQPGDLTKFLSLPWQSDFYMCRSYWWPSARPDAIVTEYDYKQVAARSKPADIAKNLTKRVPWERDIHQNYTDVYEDQPLFANTDMAKNWKYLGFIVKPPTFKERSADGEPIAPIFVETQRGIIPRKHGSNLLGFRNARSNQPPPADIPHGGGIKLPRPDSRDEPIQTIESLRTHLQAAMAVELSTIPLYLFAMYSIKTPKDYIRDPRYYDPIAGAVRGVLAEEMLHLSLAGNILLAVGGTPKLYDPLYIPSYPMAMPGRVPELTLDLKSMTQEHLQTLVDVETPGEPGAQPEPDHYHSLKQFYDAIMQGLKFLDNGKLFIPAMSKYQFAPGLGYQAKIWDAGGSVVISNLTEAYSAINTIIIQGEGSPGGEYDDPEKREKDHYDIFLELQKGPMAWEVYPVRANPTTRKYWEEDQQIYQVSRTFDAAYCFLLLTIEKLWTIENEDKRHELVLGNMFGIMMGVLAPLAKFLVQQKIGSRGENAAPCFGYYDFKHGSSALSQVQEEMQATIDSYVSVTAETPDQVVVHDFGAMLEALLPIQATVNELIDLETMKKVSRSPVKKTTVAGVQNQGYKGFAKGK